MKNAKASEYLGSRSTARTSASSPASSSPRGSTSPRSTRRWSSRPAQVHNLTLKHNNLHFVRWRNVEVPLQGEDGEELKTALDALDRVEAKVVKTQHEAARPKPHKFELVPNS